MLQERDRCLDFRSAHNALRPTWMLAIQFRYELIFVVMRRKEYAKLWLVTLTELLAYVNLHSIVALQIWSVLSRLGLGRVAILG